MILSRPELWALLTVKELALKALQKQQRKAPSEAQQEEIKALKLQRQQIKNHLMGSCLISGAQDLTSRLSLNLAVLAERFPLVHVLKVSVTCQAAPEGVEVSLSVLGSLDEVQGLVPGVLDISKMRYLTLEAKATRATPDDGFFAAEQDLCTQLALLRR